MDWAKMRGSKGEIHHLQSLNLCVRTSELTDLIMESMRAGFV